MTSFIVKVQTPLATNTGEPDLVLVYDKDRRYIFEGPSKDLADKMRALGVNKAFFLARVNKQRQFDIGKRVKDRDW